MKLTKHKTVWAFVVGTTLVWCPFSFAGVINTSGNSLDLTSGSAWVGGVPPGMNDTATFVNAGLYVGTNGAILNWGGINFAVGSVELKPTSALTINLGAGGIAGASGRLGNTDGFLTINVGSTTQTWAASQGNVGAHIAGNTDAVINLNGNGSYWFRSDNSGFKGTFELNTSGGSINSAMSGALGGIFATIIMADGTGLRLSGADQGHSVHVVIAGTIAAVTVDAGYKTGLNGVISGGSLAAPATLTINPGNGVANMLRLDGDLTPYVGSLVMNRANTSGTFTVSPGGTLGFTLGANHVVDGVDTTSQGLIHAGTGTGGVALMFNGTFVINTTNASATASNSWKLVDYTGINVSYGNAFAVQGFTVDADGVTWRRAEAGHTWTYSENTGVLTVADGGTPVATSPNDVFFMGGQSNAKVDVAIGINEVLLASGQFHNPLVVQINHGGTAISHWYSNGIPTEFYDMDLFGVTGTYDQDGQAQGKFQRALNSYGGPHKFRGFFWWQGEADSGTSASVYPTQFLGLMNKIAADSGQSIGTGANQWTYHIALPDTANHIYETIRNIQIAMINTNSTKGTYFDTRPYPRLPGNNPPNPHCSEDLDYYIGVEMGKQFLAMHGYPAVTMSAPGTLTKTAADTFSNGSSRKLGRAGGWSPLAMPGPTNTLRFGTNMSVALAYDAGGSLSGSNAIYGGYLSIYGIQYQATAPLTINYADSAGLAIGAGGLDVTGAAAPLILNANVTTTAPQTWSVPAGQSIICSNSAAVLDLHNATLTGLGTYNLCLGSYDLGAGFNTANLVFSGGGQTNKFSAAANAGSASPLGIAADIRSGVGADAVFQFYGNADATWNRNLTFDTATSPGRIGTFEITQTNVTFASSGSFGVSTNSTANILNLKLGGTGNLAISGSGGVQTRSSAVCNLEKIGNGTLTLGGSANTFNGSLAITSGKLLVAPAASVNSCSAITVGSTNTTAVFDYSGTVGLTRAVTVQSGSTFIYRSAAAMSGPLTIGTNCILIVDGALGGSSLTVPSGTRLLLRGSATLPAVFALTNNGMMDLSTWSGTLPAGFKNNGTVLLRSDVKVTSFTRNGTQFSVTIQGLLGHGYQLQSSATLQGNDWQNVGGNIEGADAPILFNHDPGLSLRMFYRVLVSP